MMVNGFVSVLPDIYALILSWPDPDEVVPDSETNSGIIIPV
jgi:hypothetical protein